MILVAVLALVVYVDQVTKAWAWRHISGVQINSGAGVLMSPTVGDLLRQPALGSMLDVMTAVVVGLLALLLVRLRSNTVALLGAATALAGWLSNLLDRLGMHQVTAPGSMRGAVDFLDWHDRVWNLADLAIAVGVTLFVISTSVGAIRHLVVLRLPAIGCCGQTKRSR